MVFININVILQYDDTREGVRGMVYRSRRVSDFTRLLNEPRRVSNFIIRYPSINPQWSVLFSLFNERANLIDILSEGLQRLW